MPVLLSMPNGTSLYNKIFMSMLNCFHGINIVLTGAREKVMAPFAPVSESVA